MLHVSRHANMNKDRLKTLHDSLQGLSPLYMSMELYLFLTSSFRLEISRLYSFSSNEYISVEMKIHYTENKKKEHLTSDSKCVV